MALGVSESVCRLDLNNVEGSGGHSGRPPWQNELAPLHHRAARDALNLDGVGDRLGPHKSPRLVYAFGLVLQLYLVQTGLCGLKPHNVGAVQVVRGLILGLGGQRGALLRDGQHELLPSSRELETFSVQCNHGDGLLHPRLHHAAQAKHLGHHDVDIAGGALARNDKRALHWEQPDVGHAQPDLQVEGAERIEGVTNLVHSRSKVGDQHRHGGASGLRALHCDLELVPTLAPLVAERVHRLDLEKRLLVQNSAVDSWPAQHALCRVDGGRRDVNGERRPHYRDTPELHLHESNPLGRGHELDLVQGLCELVIPQDRDLRVEQALGGGAIRDGDLHSVGAALLGPGVAVLVPALDQDDVLVPRDPEAVTSEPGNRGEREWGLGDEADSLGRCDPHPEDLHRDLVRPRERCGEGGVVGAIGKGQLDVAQRGRQHLGGVRQHQPEVLPQILDDDIVVLVP